MRTRKLRFLSALLAVAMMFMLVPTAAFATDATTPIDSNSISFDGNGIPTIPTNAFYSSSNTTYYYPDNNNDTNQWAMPLKNGVPNGLSIRPKYSFSGADRQVINISVTAQGTIDGGIYGKSITTGAWSTNRGTIANCVAQSTATASYGTISGGLFLGAVRTSTEGIISGGVFAQDPGSTTNTKRTLTTPGCRIYTEWAYNSYHAIADTTKVYIENAAYVVGNQEIVLTVDSPTFDHWEVNGKPLSEAELTATATRDGDTQILSFTMPDDAVEVKPVVLPVKLELDTDNGLPQYKGHDYLGNLALDGWQLRESSNSVYAYTLFINPGTTVDLGNHIVPWAVHNEGILTNGITPGNIVNYPDEEGNGCVDNIAFKMNVRLDQDSPISWVTLRNATACGGVFTDIVGVIGQQTLTVTPKVAKGDFKGWTYSGDIGPALAQQIDRQKDSYTMTLKLDGDAEDTLALTAKINGETYDLKMQDGVAYNADGDVIAAAKPGDKVTLKLEDSAIPEGMKFGQWIVSPSELELEGFDLYAQEATFTMPAAELSIRANFRTEGEDDGMDMATVVAGVAVGAGVAYLGYQVGTELYAKQILGDGVAIPRTRADVALTAWQLAGKPEVAVEGEPLSEAAMAQKWAVESGLMQNDADGSFNPAKKMSKLKALKVLDAAKKM